jgi:hypothetical protein
MEPKYYISPYSGRVIKSTGKLFNQLKEDGFIVDKHKCFYNIRTAERCLNKILSLYPYISYPPSKFIGIPRTYQKGPARAFVCDEENVIGIVDKNGKMKKLITPIPQTQELLQVKDPLNVLPKVLPKKEVVEEETQMAIENQLQEKEKLPEMSIIYNPVQDDFVPIKKETDVEEQKEILQAVNQELVPLQLPPIKEQGNVSGAIVDKESNQLIGIIDTANQIKVFREPISIAIDEKTEDLDTESESDIDIGTEPETDIKLESEPEIELESEPEIELESEPEIELESEPEIELEIELESEPEIELESESESEPEIELESESEPEIELESKSESESEPESESVTESESESEPEIELDSKAESEPEIKLDSGSETKSEIKTEEVKIEGVPTVDAESIDMTEASEIPAESEREIMEQVDKKCLDGEQYDVNSQRCLPCTYYNLVWDRETNKCRIDLKRNILITDKENNIIGFL